MRQCVSFYARPTTNRSLARALNSVLLFASYSNTRVRVAFAGLSLFVCNVFCKYGKRFKTHAKVQKIAYVQTVLQTKVVEHVVVKATTLCFVRQMFKARLSIQRRVVCKRCLLYTSNRIFKIRMTCKFLTASKQ